jgi:hypothetical protein
MTARLHKGSLFLADYAEIVTKVCDANPDTGERFCDAVERALSLIATQNADRSQVGFSSRAAGSQMGRPGVSKLPVVL